MKRPKEIEIHDRQARYRIPVRRLLELSREAARLLRSSWPARIESLEISLVTPRESSRIHREFMDDSSPTDVITFAHGELLICPAIAEKQRHEEGLNLRDEILTYIIHGMLHLCGWDDRTEKQFLAMRKKQTAIRRACLAKKQK